MGMVNEGSSALPETKPTPAYWDKKNRDIQLGGLYHDISTIVSARVTPEMSDAQVEAKWRHSRKMVIDAREQEV